MVLFWRLITYEPFLEKVTFHSFYALKTQKIVAGLKLYIQCYVIEQEPIRRNVQLSVGEKLG